MNATANSLMPELTVPQPPTAPENAPKFREPEPSSPFAPDKKVGESLSTLMEVEPPSVIREILIDSEAVAERVLSVQRAPAFMRDSLLVCLVGAATCGVLLSAISHDAVWVMAFKMPLALMAGIIAAMGPVAAASLMSGSRISWASLAAAMVSSSTAGAMMTAALLPVAIVLNRIDSHWLGPLGAVAAFGAGGIYAGSRIYAVLSALARVSWRRAALELSPDSLEQTALIARVAFVQLAFTTALSFWSLWFWRLA